MMALDRDHLCRYLHKKQGLDLADFEDTTLLFSSGIIDSFSMVDLIMFIEDTTGLRVHPADVTLDNFDSIERILALEAAGQAKAASVTTLASTSAAAAVAWSLITDRSLKPARRSH